LAKCLIESSLLLIPVLTIAETLQHIVKLTAKYIKNNYLILVIKLLIIGFFITTIVYGFNKAYMYSLFNMEPNGGFFNYLKMISETTFFRPTLIFMIPFIGVFINKKIGWILITSFFYFLFSSIVFNIKFVELIDKTDVFLIIAISTIILLIIAMMNIKKISNLTYGIAKTELISKNIIASVIGMSLTIVVLIIRTK
jgi:hypothetical protein